MCDAVWGLDFGDCHKSMFAHQDHIISVKVTAYSRFGSRASLAFCPSVHSDGAFVCCEMQFVPNTHYFFSVSKDKTLKYWVCRTRNPPLLT